METSDLFDAVGYFTALTGSNKLAQTEMFVPCQSSGPASIKGIVENMGAQKAFVCIDDTNESRTFSSGSAYFVRRVFTVSILIRYASGDMDDRKRKLDICHRLFRQFHSRIIRDKYCSDRMLEYVDGRNIMSRDYGLYFLDGITGLYFVVQSNEPVELCFDESEWTE